MFTYSSLSLSRPPHSENKWLSTKEANQHQSAGIGKVLGGIFELLLLAGAVTFLVLSQQDWAQGFWLSHSAVLISSSVACALIGLDISVALVISIMNCTSINNGPDQLSKEKIRIGTPEEWEGICRQTVAKRDPEFEKIYKPFCLALSQQGANLDDYQLIVFREATRYKPGLFTSDGVAPEFVLEDTINTNPLNLRNYPPSQILVVTYYAGEEYEADCIENPNQSIGPDADTTIHDYLNDQIVHVHLNQQDLNVLKERQNLSSQVIETVIQKTAIGS